jgi:hypothetical protein
MRATYEAGQRMKCRGDKMVKSDRIFAATLAFLLLGFTVPVNARQGHEEQPKEQEKPQEQAKPAEKQQQPAKPARQAQPQAAKQQDQPHPQQQEQKPQQQAKAPQPQQQKPQQEAKAKTRPQDNAPKPQQQAKAPQQQQPKPQQQAKVQQHQTQAVSVHAPQRTQQAMSTQRAQPALRLSARGTGRIPDARFQSNFGRGHEFHMGNPVMVGGYSRFQYGGFWFGFVEPWPVGWYYTDDVYIDYVDGGYYMFDPYYPGTRFAISVVI